MAKTTPKAQTEILERIDAEVDKRLKVRTVNLSKVRYAYDEKGNSGALIIGGNIKAKLDGKGEGQFLEEMNIPSPYWKKIDPELRVITANHLLKKREGDEKAERNAYILDNNRFLGFQLSQRPVIPAVKVAKNVFEAIPTGDWQISDKDTHFDPYECRLSIFRRNNHEIKKGDIVKAGFTTSFSPIGDYVTRVEQYAYRLVCANGMIAPTGKHGMSLYGKDDERMFTRVREAIAAVWGNVEAMIEGFKNLTQMKVRNPQQYMEHLFKVHHLPPGMRDYVRDAFEIEGGDSMWEITNAFTRAANAEEVVQDFDTRRTLQAFGGNLAMNESFRVCGACGHHLN